MSCVEQGVAILGTVGTLWGSLLIFQDRVLELLKQRINSESFGESVRLAFVLCWVRQVWCIFVITLKAVDFDTSHIL